MLQQRVLGWIVMSLLTGFASTAGASNLLTNPDFDTNTNNWFAQSVNDPLAWDGLSNVVGAPGSGSALVADTAPFAFTGGVTQCVTTGVVAGTLYNISGWIRIPSGQPSNGGAFISLSFYDGPNCNNNALDVANASFFPVEYDVWKRVTKTLLAPSGTLSAWVYLTVGKPDAQTFAASFDGISLQPEVVFKNGFD